MDAPLFRRTKRIHGVSDLIVPWRPPASFLENSTMSSSPRRPSRSLLGWVARGIGLTVLWGRWLLLFWLIWFLVSGQWKWEIARWRLAAADNTLWTGDSEARSRNIEAAVYWAPEMPATLLALARQYARQQQWEQALQACDRSAELQAQPPLESWSTKLELLQAADRFAEAADVAAQMTEAVRQRLKTVQAVESGYWRSLLEQSLNGAAYARALAGTDLDMAATEAAEALNMAQEERLQNKLARKAGKRGRVAPLNSNDAVASILDTHAFIRYQRGEIRSAQTELDQAVVLIERRLTTLLLRSLPVQELQRVDMRPVFLQVELMKRSVAVIRYHRALAYQKSSPRRSRADLRRVRQLGFTPGPRLY